ncbi:head GIN domain-containing protein [Kozakia baliensis]|uniref:Uncharacterized protein n=1 Tax=Kozakia baliensis TaxID=153496 RepID=A0A1D8UQ92_9PROT|nr:hypothetical protein [Kozakia baliensis]AOX15815.1 hypothetical protein A0U89_00260 [Kozakia baliensis]GBR24262.1 hypothetical protein AA0488_0346 [Kozakia baliensis NRIC 0488]GEL64568.1 hypothetical protein KBA01_18540 [Kozakia baliensis]
MSGVLRQGIFFTAVSGMLALAPHAYAQHQTVAAEDLDLSTPCIGRVQVNVDPAMSNGVSFDASAANAAHVTIRTGKNEGASKVIIVSKSCAPHAVLSILVAPNIGVSIHDSHDTHFVINGTLASLEASLESGQLEADTIQSLDLSLRGTEQVHIANLNRAAQIVASGSASLVADRAELDALSAQLSDSSRLNILDGKFDALTLMTEGGASATIGGTANTATVNATGSGYVAIPRVSGPLARTGTGAVQVGPAPPSPPPSPPPAAPPPPPPANTASPSRTPTPEAPAPLPPQQPVPAAPQPVPPATVNAPPSASAPTPSETAPPAKTPESKAAPPSVPASPAPSTKQNAQPLDEHADALEKQESRSPDVATPAPALTAPSETAKEKPSNEGDQPKAGAMPQGGKQQP